ncbi:ABC transporter permease [Chelativorans sp. Marseille-P2723]|uniref:ABC transporter permease n=1 Tax=Chelativorans sp. Marseille-P2723 TaxID=2709133 RepID=UPI00156E976B|nr:ABC transporter permease [Chelativorans sp. Marseille-P2723]
MKRYIAFRVLQSAVSLVVVAVVVFFLSRISGDPIDTMLPVEATAAEREILRQQLGLDRNILSQLGTFLANLAQGDLGRSFRYNQPVADLLLERAPNSLLLAFVAIFIALVVGLPVGIMAARWPGSIIDRIGRTLAVSGQSIPTFVVGVILVLVFSVQFRIFPSGGTGSFSHLVLPAITLGWFSTAAITRMARSSMLEALNSNYITVARAKGLPEWTIVMRYAFPNALTTIMSLTALQFVLLASGAVITEAIFDWPGIGLLMVQGAFARDYALVQGVVIVAAFTAILVNLLTDILYAVVDPRIVLTRRS